MNKNNTQIIVGPPGTGKTTRLLQIVEDSLASGTKPNEIGFISFTKKAADEGKLRAMERFNLDDDALPNFRTLHSFAFKDLGMRREQVLSWSHIKELGNKLGIEFKGKVPEDGDIYGMNTADRMLFLDGLARNRREPLRRIWEEAQEDAIDWSELERFSRALTSYKVANGLRDYTDMIELFLSGSPSHLPRFKDLVVDEAQDLSIIQWEMVRMIAQNAERVHVGGDDDQAIYRWSGADVAQFIDLAGAVTNLEQSYRVPTDVHRIAESVAQRIVNRRTKIWKPRTEKGAVAYHSSYEDVDISKGTWLLLARNGYMLPPLENWCLSNGFSFNSVNRDPLKSKALQAISQWEKLRKGQGVLVADAVLMLKYVSPRLLGGDVAEWLRGSAENDVVGMSSLLQHGLRGDPIWHEALTKISPTERDYFIAARRRGEPLLKTPRIRISTIHSVKGGEADHVLLMTDMSARCFRNMQENPDDENRVFYVATTRCKKTLNIVLPRSRYSFEL